MQFPHVCNILIHPDDSDLLLLTLEHGGVVRSEDRGKTWEDASSGIDYLDMHHIYNYPGSKDRYYVSCARGFFRSDDRGRQWRRVEDGMPWGYTEKYSYTPRLVLPAGRHPADDGVRGARLPRSLARRGHQPPRRHHAER